MLTRSKLAALLVLVCVWPALAWGQQEMRSSTKGSSTPLPITGTSIDSNHNGLDVNVVGGTITGTGGTQYDEDTAHASGDKLTMAGVVQKSADAALASDGDNTALQVDSNGFLKVNIKAGAGSGGTAMTDDAAFTPGTTSITPMGAIFDDVSPDSVNEGDGGVPRMSANRNIYTTLRDAAGNERGANINASNELLTNANTELPAAAALADSTSNPTAPAVGVFPHSWNGSSWDRAKSATAGAGNVDSTTQRVVLANNSFPCTSYAAISQTADAAVITATAAQYAYICSIVIVAGAAEVVSIWEGTGAACGTGSAAILGSTTEANGLSFAANGGFTVASGIPILRTASTNVDVCVRQSGANRVSGFITYTKAP